ncbi:ABC transporter permease [Pannonibacter carbonis]|uniref:ABC transporter permease n=1 Tax=Pannonibacter carbonis TaxID=2067569 RepID=UPI000D0F4B70|nr:ABC transporter permease [Pannonibacter carbonis]
MTVLSEKARIRSIRKRPSLQIGVALASGFLMLILFITLFAQAIQPYAFEQISLLDRMKPPFPLEGYSADHLLGTDRLGRDLLSRLLVATQTSIALALLGTIFGAVLGTGLGFLAAHYGGWVDEIISALVDFGASMPYFIIALAVLAFLGNSMLVFLFLMGIYGWERYARITRGLVLSARQEGYALAVHALGGSPARIYARHVLPNIMGPLIIQITINFPETILFETSLSFIGLGIRPPLTSLGQLLGDGRDYLINAWWLAVIPGLVIFFTTLSISILGDHLRARLDPTSQG